MELAHPPGSGRGPFRITGGEGAPTPKEKDAPHPASLPSVASAGVIQMGGLVARAFGVVWGGLPPSVLAEPHGNSGGLVPTRLCRWTGSVFSVAFASPRFPAPSCLCTGRRGFFGALCVEAWVLSPHSEDLPRDTPGEEPRSPGEDQLHQNP